MFAFDVPYSFLESEKYFNKILFKKFKTMLKIEKKEYGRTISGSPLVSYQIKRKKPRGDSIQLHSAVSEAILPKEKRRSVNLSPINHSSSYIDPINKSIVIIGRCEGSDTNSSFAIEGMIDYLLDSIEFESMKRVFDFYFIPLANIDAIKYGNSVCNLTGNKLNRCWRSPQR